MIPTTNQRGGELLFSRLRSETHDMHRAVEQLVPPLDQRATLQSYRAFLALMWGFHAPLERQLSAHASARLIVRDLDRRLKATLLAQDLAELGWPVAALEECTELPPLVRAEEVVGVQYVLEGSTLGGQYIQRQLSAHLPEELARARAFLSCYGPRTGAMWNGFRQQVRDHAERLEPDLVIASAHDTFAALKRWLETHATVLGARGPAWN